MRSLWSWSNHSSCPSSLYTEHGICGSCFVVLPMLTFLLSKRSKKKIKGREERCSHNLFHQPGLWLELVLAWRKDLNLHAVTLRGQEGDGRDRWNTRSTGFLVFYKTWQLPREKGEIMAQGTVWLRTAASGLACLRKMHPNKIWTSHWPVLVD